MPGNNSDTTVHPSSEKFTLPHWRSWHFERTLKPDDRKVSGNFALLEAGVPDRLKVLESYTHHPVEGYNIASIEIVYNEQLNRVFYGNLKMMNARYGNSKYRPVWKQDSDSSEKRHRERVQEQLNQLAVAHQDQEIPHVDVLPLWHGTDDTTADYIFNMGYGIFTSNMPGIVTDPGFFGKGIYGAHEARYSFDAYAKKHGDNAVLILNWVSSFEAYPVIDGDMPKLQGKMGGFDQSDAHFIPVRSDDHPHTDVYLPCKSNQASQYTEMVVFSPVQFLPRYRVKLTKSAPQPAIDDAATMAYQMGLDFVGLHQYGMVAPSWDQANDAEYPGAYVRLHWWYSGASGVMAKDDVALASLTEPSSAVFGQLQARARLFGLNDAESQFLLGWCYEHGLCGLDKKPELAAQYYWVAASQNHRDALYHLGLCCSTGFGVGQNTSQAVNYYEAASQQNHVHAHYILSQLNTLGFGVTPDAVKAATYRQQAQQGHHPALAAGFALSPVASPNPGLKKRITQLEQEVADKKSQIADKDSKIATLRDDVKQKDSKIDQIKQAANQQATKVTQLEKDVSQQQQQLQQQASQVNQLKQKDKKQAAQVKQLEKTNKEQTEKVSDLEQILADKEQEIAKLRQGQKQRPATPSKGGVFGVNAADLQQRLNQTQLLHHIVRGDIKAVEKILSDRNNAELLLVKSRFKDLSKSQREFNASALQYVYWARDAAMFSLLLDYADKRIAKEQLTELKHHPNRLSRYGSSHSLDKLIKVSQTYLDSYGNWNYDQREKYWCETVGGEQADCPAWYWYVWYEKGDQTYWTLQDPTRGFKRDPAAAEWFTKHTHNGGVIGNTRAAVRGECGELAAKGANNYAFQYSETAHDIGVHTQSDRHATESLDNLATTKLPSMIPQC